MPYIITEKWQGAVHPKPGPNNPTAVATLDEARDHVTGLFPFPQYGHRVTERVGNDLSAMSESGGTVGPLPDGTVIEVRPVEWATLNGEHGYTLKPSPAMAERILAAFNAA